MDKVEYKIRADEIKALIGEGRFAEAVNIADTIDWKRVKSVTMLCTISDLYKLNRRFQESKDILLMAYDRHPTGRLIVYSLCELSIKMGEFVQAVEYYKEFVRIAPRDTGRYILQYKLYEAQEVSLEERIAVLEEFKKHDYRERWAYELAYLYHRVGLTTECIEECDEIFLWFGDGRYVMKALELKALHEPLSPQQQDRYVRYKQSHGGMVDASIVNEKDEVGKDETRTVEIKQPTKELPRVTNKMIDDYNKGVTPVVEEETDETREFNPADIEKAAKVPLKEDLDEQDVPEETGQIRDIDEIVYPHISEIKEPTYDVSKYNTLNLQESLRESLKEVIGQDTREMDTVAAQTLEFGAGGLQPITEEIFEDVEDFPEEDEGTETFFDQSGDYQELKPQLTENLREDYGEDELEGDEEDYPDEEYQEDYQDEAPEPAPDAGNSDTGQMEELFFDTSPHMGIEIKHSTRGPILGEAKITAYEEEDSYDSEDSYESQAPYEDDFTEEFEAVAEEESDASIEEEPKALIKEEPEVPIEEELKAPDEEETEEIIPANRPLEDEVPGAVIHPNANYQMHNHFESMLTQESDGQITLAVEPEPEVEKQITGQISIAEYLENWEQFKKSQQQKQLESVKQRVADETGDMFADFDVKTKVGLQERIEKAINDAIKKEREDKFSGRGDWSVTREDVINKAIDSVVNAPPEEEEAVPEEKDELQNENIERESVNQEPDDIETSEEPAGEETAADDTAKAEEESPSEEVASSSRDEKAKESPEKTNDVSDKHKDTDSPPKEKEADKPEDKKKQHIGNREIEERVRSMTPEEKELFGPYIHHKKSRRQIINAIDNLSMDAYSGNAVVTGEEGAGTVNLAKGLIKAMQAQDANFNGKVAKITANTLNKRSTSGVFDKLANGALIIQRAADLDQDTVGELLKILQNENKGLVLVMEDTREDMDRFLDNNPALKQSFNVRVDIEALDDDSLVAYARQYALEKEFSIDNLGILALHTRISERQTLDHDVTVSEVKDIVDDAIYFATKRNLGHFVDLLVNKRYDENDMIILREKDFMHD